MITRIVKGKRRLHEFQVIYHTADRSDLLHAIIIRSASVLLAWEY